MHRPGYCFGICLLTKDVGEEKKKSRRGLYSVSRGGSLAETRVDCVVMSMRGGDMIETPMKFL